MFQLCLDRELWQQAFLPSTDGARVIFSLQCAPCSSMHHCRAQLAQFAIKTDSRDFDTQVFTSIAEFAKLTFNKRRRQNKQGRVYLAAIKMHCCIYATSLQGYTIGLAKNNLRLPINVLTTIRFFTLDKFEDISQISMTNLG